MPKVIFEDDYLLVLDKPPGIVVDRSETQQSGTLEDWLGNRLRSTGYSLRLERNGIVHRLDKDTSGLLVVAKTLQALENLQDQFKNRVVKKEYLALVHGSILEPGRVEGNIGRNPKNRERFSVVLDGKEAVTEYEPIDRLQVTGYRLQEIFSDFNKIQMRKLEKQKYGEFTLVLCKPKTGRTHQIRVHLKHIGYPIVSDETYVGRKMYRLDKRWCPRQFLHARKIGFKHPLGGEWVEFESEMPVDISEVLKMLDS